MHLFTSFRLKAEVRRRTPGATEVPFWGGKAFLAAGAGSLTEDAQHKPLYRWNSLCVLHHRSLYTYIRHEIVHISLLTRSVSRGEH